MNECPLQLVNLRSAPAVPSWHVVNDPVMGGRSSSRVEIGDGVLRFRGELSLADGGGFASVRTAGRTWNLVGRRELLLTVRGDGREYQVRLHDGRLWQGKRVTHAGRFVAPVDGWRQVAVALDALAPVCRGRPVPGPALDLGRVLDLGLMIADRRAGPFTLELSGLDAR